MMRRHVLGKALNWAWFIIAINVYMVLDSE